MYREPGGWYDEPVPILMQMCTWVCVLLFYIFIASNHYNIVNNHQYQAGFLVCIGFMSVSLASGLYYIAEMAEENSVIARKTLKYWIILVIITNVLLLLSGSINWMLSVVSIVSEVCYSGLLKDYPFTKLSEPAVTLSGICFVIDTILWYNYFTDYETPSYSVPQITGFFALFVWPVPFGFFITLSVADQGLPGLGSINNQGEGFGDFKRRRYVNFISFFLIIKFNIS